MRANPERNTLFSIEISLLSLTIRKLQSRNNAEFIPNALILNISLKMPANKLNISAHFNSKVKLAITTKIKSRHGLIVSILK